MGKHKRLAYYENGIAQQEAILEQVNKRYNVLSWGRLVVFALGVAVTYGFFQWNEVVGIAGGVAGLLLFLYLIKLHTEIAQKRDHHKRLLLVQQRELSALGGEYLDFYPGKEWIDPQHAYSYDMDLFGRASIFQFLNRAGTLMGRKRLAAWLQQPLRSVSEILNRQQSVQELASLPDWSLEFQALGMAELEAKDDSESLLNWVKQPAFFLTKSYLPILSWLLPTLFFVSFGGYLLSDVPGLRGALSGITWLGRFSLVIVLIQFLVVGKFMKKTSLTQVQVGKKANVLRKYASLLQAIEQQDWQAEELKQHQAKLLGTDRKASEAIAELGELIYRLDQRMNVFMGLILNGVMLWDIRYMLKLERWQKQNQDHLPEWLAVVSEWDALLSLSRYAFHHPTYAYPELSEGPFFLEAKALGHPLLNPEKRVDNDLSIGKPGEFLIVTGANMAGKSTFLRTVGVNLVLGMLGAPVCAQSMRLVPIDLITSVRATDSLSDDESYFFAELKQLKRIIDKLKSEGPAFVIVDEMLRGTNSRDKQTGSRQFIEQLIALRAVGMIATHDLALGKLAEDYPDFARNKRFEVDITDNQLSFDYRLQDGISQNLNATFLMRQMGIMP